MARLSHEELQEIIKKEGVSRIWSWSKFNCFHTSPFEYFLKYIKKAEEDRTDCIYTTTGGIAHDILERHYSGSLAYQDMINDFEDGWVTAVDIADMKFDRNSPEKNDTISQKYFENLQHFFKNHTPLKYKPMIEQFVKAKIDGNLFQGYIDICFKDDEGNINIVDWKTSSIYKGAKAENECGQLVVYAIGLNQQGIPMDKIKICWNFLKYVSIQYQQKNGAVKTREVERCKIGESLQSNAKMWLKAGGYDVDEYLKLLLDTNSIECLPNDVKEKYVISDYYVYVPLTDKLIDKWTTEISTTLKDIMLREEDYKETENDKVFWDTEESVKAQSYYFSTLCAYSPNLHLPYKAYLDKMEAAKNGEDTFGGLGTNDETVVETSKGKHQNIENAEVDLSWLDEV